MWSLLATALAAPPSPAEGTVSSVEFRGLVRVERAVVEAAMRLRKGSELTPEAVRGDVRALWATGLFDDVVVELDGGVLTVRVDERPGLEGWRIEGNDKVGDDDLEEVVALEKGAIVDRKELHATADALRAVCVEKGFWLAEVAVEEVDVGPDVVEVVFRVDEGRKVAVRELVLSGNEHLADADLRAVMATRPTTLLGGGRYDDVALAQDVERIRWKYLDEGYLDVEVDAPDVHLSLDRRSLHVGIAVREGRRYTLGEVRVEGEFPAEDGLTAERVRAIVEGRSLLVVQTAAWRESQGRTVRDAPFTPALIPGETYRISEVLAVLDAIGQLYGDAGYAFAGAVQDPRTNDDGTVDLVIRVDAGERVHVGQIEIAGNVETFDHVIRRMLPIAEGELYRASRLRSGREALLRTGWFDEVAITTPKAGDGVVDVRVEVAEKKTGQFTAGIGGTQTGPTAMGSVEQDNFQGTGWRLAAQGNASWRGVNNNGGLSFFDPSVADSDWTLRVSGSGASQRLDGDDLKQTRGGVSVEVGRYLDPSRALELSLRYGLTGSRLGEVDPYRRMLLGGELYRDGTSSALGAALRWDRRDSWRTPRKGWFFEARGDVVGGFLTSPDELLSIGGDFHYVEGRLGARVYQPIWKDALFFRANANIAAMASTDGRVIPVAERYRLGGVDSVRGYAPFSLGPTLRVVDGDPVHADDALVVGGTTSAVLNAEIVAAVVPKAGIDGLVFFDAGNAWGDPWGELGALRLYSAVGAGLTWQSPMGPLRFVVGAPLQRPDGTPALRFDVGFGTQF